MLTERQTKWLINHFKHTKNAEIAARLHISQSSVSRYARIYNLHKTPQFIRKCMSEMTEAARKANLLRVVPEGFRIPGGEKYQFKKGVRSVDRLGKKKEAKRVESVRASRNATIRKERARIAFGLPQKTKLKIGRQPRERVLLRYYLKKRGYVVDDDRRIAYYDADTLRGKRVESRQQPWYKFEPIDNINGQYQ